jgi:circadian clock protein KaiC
MGIERVSTGMTELDKMLAGGFPANTTILLSGDAGTGKTLFGLNWLVAGAARGERCCFLSVCENEEELLRACSGLDALKDAPKYLNRNLVFRYVALGKHMDVGSFADLFNAYPSVDRLVIDNVNKLLLFAPNVREYRLALAQLVRTVKEKSKCTLVLCEAIGDRADTGNGEAFECDGVINISFSELEERPMRTLRVCKMRYTNFEPLVRRKLDITSQGIKLTTTKII